MLCWESSREQKVGRKERVGERVLGGMGLC